MSVHLRIRRLRPGLPAITLISLLAAGSAVAQDQTPAGGGHDRNSHGEGFRTACAADLQTYCSSAQSRDERHQCMTANHDKLSDACKSFIDSHAHGAGGH